MKARQLVEHDKRASPCDKSKSASARERAPRGFTGASHFLSRGILEKASAQGRTFDRYKSSIQAGSLFSHVYTVLFPLSKREFVGPGREINRRDQPRSTRKIQHEKTEVITVSLVPMRACPWNLRPLLIACLSLRVRTNGNDARKCEEFTGDRGQRGLPEPFPG